jgi:hypothetical protein
MRSRALEAPCRGSESDGDEAVSRTVAPTITVTLRREREAGIGSAKTMTSVRGPAFVARCGRTIQQTTHFSKTENPSFTRFPVRVFTRDRRASRFMARGSLPIVVVCEVCRPFRPPLRENRLSSDAPIGPLSAEPHERCRPSTIQSAFGRRAGSDESKTARRPSANRREDRAHPGAARSPARRRV